MMILAPLAAALIQMAISRSREFDADAASAKYTGSPDELISALGKLESGVAQDPDGRRHARHGALVYPESVFRQADGAAILDPSSDGRADRPAASHEKRCRPEPFAIEASEATRIA